MPPSENVTKSKENEYPMRRRESEESYLDLPLLVSTGMRSVTMPILLKTSRHYIRLPEGTIRTELYRISAS